MCIRDRLGAAAATKATAPQGVGEVFKDLLLKMVDNPVNALGQANYIGVLVWAVVFGFAMRTASTHTKDLLHKMCIRDRFINWLQAGRIWSHSFLREGPQRMPEGQTSKTRFL